MTDEQPTTPPPQHDVDEDDSLDDEEDDSLDDEELTTGQTTSALGVAAGGGEATLDAYDLDEDGKVSLVEGARSQLGIVDARLEEIGEHPGFVGRIAEAAHHVVDRLDNDDDDADDARQSPSNEDPDGTAPAGDA
jgi:hypothetical protein